MRAAGLAGVSRRKGPRTTIRAKDARPAPDLVDRNFTASAPDQLWVADITYIPTWAGFLYLAVVLDAWSRRVVGWAMATHLRTDLVLDALNMAFTQRRPTDVIHHSDRAAQYTSIAFGQRCREMGVRPSMGSVGDAYDNAMCESFFATLECELLDRVRFKTQVDARLAVFEFIEGWYNGCDRPQSLQPRGRRDRCRRRPARLSRDQARHLARRSASGRGALPGGTPRTPEHSDTPQLGGERTAAALVRGPNHAQLGRDVFRDRTHCRAAGIRRPHRDAGERRLDARRAGVVGLAIGGARPSDRWRRAQRAAVAARSGSWYARPPRDSISVSSSRSTSTTPSSLLEEGALDDAPNDVGSPRNRGDGGRRATRARADAAPHHARGRSGGRHARGAWSGWWPPKTSSRARPA
jgi:Integrase core domain